MSLEDKVSNGRKFSTVKTLAALAGALITQYALPTPAFADPTKEQEVQIQRLEQKVTSSPSFDNHLALGRMYATTDQKTKAVQQFHLAERAMANTYENHVALGREYARVQEWAESKDEADAALRIKQDNPSAFILLSEAHAGLGQYTESASAAQRGLQVMPYNGVLMADHAAATYMVQRQNNTQTAAQAREGFIKMYAGLAIETARNPNNVAALRDGINNFKIDCQRRFPQLYQELSQVETALAPGNRFPKQGIAADVLSQVYNAGRDAFHARDYLVAKSFYTYFANKGDPEKRSTSLARRLAQVCQTRYDQAQSNK